MAILRDSNIALPFSGNRGASSFFSKTGSSPSPFLVSSFFRRAQILRCEEVSVVRAQDLDVPFSYYGSQAFHSFSGYHGTSQFLFEHALLPAPSFSSRLVKDTDISLAAERVSLYGYPA